MNLIDQKKCITVSLCLLLVVGRILKWPARLPPPGIYTLYNSLPLSVGRTWEYDGEYKVTLDKLPYMAKMMSLP